MERRVLQKRDQRTKHRLNHTCVRLWKQDFLHIGSGEPLSIIRSDEIAALISVGTAPQQNVL